MAKVTAEQARLVAALTPEEIDGMTDAQMQFYLDDAGERSRQGRVMLPLVEYKRLNPAKFLPKE